MLASLLDLPLMTHSGGEAGGTEANVCVAVRDRLASRAERFRRLYPALRDTFRA